MFEGCSGIGAETGMGGCGLNDGAARRDEPVETLRLRELTDIARLCTTLTDTWNRGKVFLYQCHVAIGCQSEQTLRVKFDERTQEAARAANENNAHVDAFTALDARDNADNSVIKRAAHVHPLPPLRRHSPTPTGSAGNRNTPRGVHQSF